MLLLNHRVARGPAGSSPSDGRRGPGTASCFLLGLRPASQVCGISFHPAGGETGCRYLRCPPPRTVPVGAVSAAGQPGHPLGGQVRHSCVCLVTADRVSDILNFTFCGADFIFMRYLELCFQSVVKRPSGRVALCGRLLGSVRWVKGRSLQSRGHVLQSLRPNPVNYGTLHAAGWSRPPAGLDERGGHPVPRAVCSQPCTDRLPAEVPEPPAPAPQPGRPRSHLPPLRGRDGHPLPGLQCLKTMLYVFRRGLLASSEGHVWFLLLHPGRRPSPVYVLV